MTEQKEDPSQAEAITPENVLKSASFKLNTLEEEADQALTMKDTKLCRQKLVEQAEMIVSLPDQVNGALKKGGSFPKQDLDELQRFAQLANEVLESEGDLGALFLLFPKGTKVGEPNQLEKMVERLYPSSEED